eukprot:m.374359 g.374359  ORF g.374359 m.374359 type:complete len:468 (-) comp20904_c0_seq3:257-1660(-)
MESDEGMEMADGMDVDVERLDPVNEAQQEPLVDNPSMDLDAYVSEYEGNTKISRLCFIANRCPSFRMEAYQICHSELKKMGSRPQLQRDIALKLQSASAASNVPCDVQPLAPAEVKEQLERLKKHRETLEASLKIHRVNMVKENIRVGYMELGDHFYATGDLQTALKVYQRCRDHTSSAAHVIQLCRSIIKVSLELLNVANLLNYVAKADTTCGADSKSSFENAVLATEMHCAAGLGHLIIGDHDHAATAFLQASFEHCNFPTMLSRKDVATYGGLCALACLSRQEIKKEVLTNAGFKDFLELFPEMREIIKDFSQSRYGSCLATMERIKPDLLLDMHLSVHVDALYKRIREKMLVQYFSPFLTVDAHVMADAFGITTAALEEEFAKLIASGMVQARIDSDKKVFHARRVNKRSKTFAKAIAVGTQYQIHTQSILIRTAMIKAGLCVQAKRGNNMHIDHYAPMDESS